METVQELVRQMESADTTGSTQVSKYVTQNLREDVNTTEAYLNSKHISGSTDHLGREKPFFNIVTAAVNVWFRATDLDVKNVKIIAETDKQVIPSLLATIKLKMWMKREQFSTVLNDWGLSLARHGSSILKFIEKGGELHISVIDWNTIIVDPIDFENNPKIEVLWLTPSQLRKNKSYDQEFVKKLIEKTTSRENISGQTKDNKANYIKIYEVHGELPLSLLTDKEEDDDTFVQQMHVVSFTEKNDKKGFDDYTLYSGKEARDPYFITHLLKKDGQTYSGGAVKNLFEAQWMVNDTQKKIKDQLDLASKIIYQTSDGNFVGQNALTGIENGDILNHKINEPLTRLAGSPDTVAMQNFKNDWQAVANQINGIADAMVEAPTAGTAWRSMQAQLQEAHSLFEIMTENKGNALKEILTTYIIPYFKKQLDNADEISGLLDEMDIKEIDSRYLPNEVIRRVNNKIKDTVLSGQIYDTGNQPNDIATAQQDIMSKLKGNQRFITPSEVKGSTWKKLFEDLEWILDYDITGESKDVQGALATLGTALQTIAPNPMILQDPNVKMIFNRILALSGTVSPLEIQNTQAQSMQPPTQPNQQTQQPVMVGAKQ